MSVDTHAVVEDCGTFRRADPDGLFIKPLGLDGDGELHVSIADLGVALRMLGINAVDLGYTQ